MCGRYHFNILASRKGKQLKEKAISLNLTYKEGEIFPDDKVLCIIPSENKIDLEVMKWGIKSRSLIINARYETLDYRPAFAQYTHNRCAVIADCFYEWDKDKHRYEIRTADDYMYLACICNNQKELVILTIASDEQFKNIHDRMPIVMDKDEMLCFVHNQDCVFAKKSFMFKKMEDEIKLF